MRNIRGMFMLVILFVLTIPSLVFGIGVQINWSANSETDIAGYKVYAGTSSGVYGTPVDVGTSLTCSFPGLKNGTTYYFAVTAYDTSGNESAKSVEVSSTIPLLPTAPVPTATPGVKSIVVTWASVANAVGYKVYYGTASGVYGTPVVSTATSATLSMLQDGTKYYIAVTSVDQYQQESAKSVEVSSTTKDTTAPGAPSKPTLNIIP